MFVPYYGSNRISRYLRKLFERHTVAELIGIPLTSIAFFGAVILPQAQSKLAFADIYVDTQTTVVDALVLPSRFRWPLASFGISQHFSAFHRGIDLTDPKGTLMYPVLEGTVTSVTTQFVGYGKHVIVTHDGGMSSLYAHLSNITVKEGQKVTKQTEIGTVGATGWATGNHLHLEMYQNGVALNPMEVLPQIQKSQTRAISQIDASTPLPYLSL